MDTNASTSNLTANSPPFYPPSSAFSINSGASHHLTGNRQVFAPGSLVHVNNTLRVGNTRVINIEGRGSISRRGFTLPEVLYVPGLDVNMVSVAQLGKMDYDVLFSGKVCLVKDSISGEVVGKATRLDDGSYMVDYLRIPLGLSCLPNNETFEAALNLR